MRKIKPRVQFFGDGLMLGKLFTVIRGNSMDSVFHLTQQSHNGLLDGAYRASFDMCNQGIHRFTLVQGHQCLLMAFANDGVHFPVAYTRLPVNNGGALINTDLIRQASTALITAITLLAFLLAAQVPVQVPPSALS